MFHIRLLAFLFLLPLSHCFSQNEKVEQMYDVLRSANRAYFDESKNINYLKPLSILIKNQNDFRDIDPYDYQDYIDFLNTAYSYVHATDSITDTTDRILISDKAGISDPVSYIIDKIGDTSVLMLNEAHNAPEHRLFAQSLLKPLRDKGFDYLAIETLYWSDTLINQRKYPISTSGYYSREPYFSNFIRTAIKEGFTIVPYEQETGTGDINERETNQANNLINIITKNPSAKIFVYAGYSHIKKKSDDEDIKWMAERFKDSTGINPITIDQITFKASSNDGLPVLIDLQANNDSLTYPYKDNYDMAILNYGESKQLHQKLDKKDYEVHFENNDKNEFPLILQAYITSEYAESGNRAVPFDQKLITNKKDGITLFLEPNEKYLLIIKDSDNNKLVEKEVQANKKAFKI